jgi:hypothetical protein
MGKEEIPLTEIELEKLGFTSVGLSGNVFVHSKELHRKDGKKSYFRIEVFDYGFEPMIDYEPIYGSNIKYVSDLMNLYHALTGNVLTIKQPAQ